MKALLLEAVGRIRYTDVPDATITRPGQVLVRVAAASICGSDVHGYQGRPPGRTPPLIMGHEVAGTVEAVGAAVENVRPGDRIFVLPGISCFRCESCLDGRWDDCRDRRFYGANMAGGFADLLVIDHTSAVPIPDQVSFRQAALIEPLSVAIKAVSRVHFVPGDTSVVIGAGSIGLMATAMLARYTPRHLVVVNRNHERDAMLRDLGATLILDPGDPALTSTVLDLTNGVGADHCIEAVGVSGTMQHAIDLTRPSGTIVWAGNISTTIEVDELMAVFNQLDILGTMGVTRTGVLRAIRLIADGAVDVERLLSLTAPLSDGPSVFDRMVHDRSIIKAMFLTA
jgi:L-iditol 2-dehydrogenase